MRAVVFSEWQTSPGLEDVEQPEPGPGEVLLRVAGAGAGQIRPDIERFAMDDALDAYRQLESGALSGRAVVTPHE